MRALTLALSALLLLSSCAMFSNDNREKAELHLRVGTSYYEGGNYPQALAELLNAEKLDRTNPVVQNNLGLVYFMRERYDLAVTHLQKAVELKPSYTDARNNLARVLLESGKYTAAEEQLKIVLNDLTYTGMARAWVNMGLLKFSQKKWSEASQAFAKALQESRDNCMANSYYGRSLFEMKQYDRAAENLDRAVGFCQKENFDEPHYYSALAWYRLGDKDRSIARFEEVRKLYPEGKYREKASAMLDLIRKGVE